MLLRTKNCRKCGFPPAQPKRRKHRGREHVREHKMSGEMDDHVQVVWLVENRRAAAGIGKARVRIKFPRTEPDTEGAATQGDTDDQRCPGLSPPP